MSPIQQSQSLSGRGGEESESESMWMCVRVYKRGREREREGEGRIKAGVVWKCMKSVRASCVRERVVWVCIEARWRENIGKLMLTQRKCVCVRVRESPRVCVSLRE